MQFSTFTTLSILSPLLLTLASADGIFSITGSGTPSPDGQSTSVTLTVLNGLTTDPPTCTGTTVTAGGLPAGGTIPCSDGYALAYVWSERGQGVAATYTNPSVTFTYNVPNNGCDASTNTCQFGFTDLFPGKKARGFKA